MKSLKKFLDRLLCDSKSTLLYRSPLATFECTSILSCDLVGMAKRSSSQTVANVKVHAEATFRGHPLARINLSSTITDRSFLQWLPFELPCLRNCATSKNGFLVGDSDKQFPKRQDRLRNSFWTANCSLGPTQYSQFNWKSEFSRSEVGFFSKSVRRT